MSGNARQNEIDVTAFARRMEEATYITYREWPIFLIRRDRQLIAIMTQSGATMLPTTIDDPHQSPMKKDNE